MTDEMTDRLKGCIVAIGPMMATVDGVKQMMQERWGYHKTNIDGRGVWNKITTARAKERTKAVTSTEPTTLADVRKAVEPTFDPAQMPKAVVPTTASLDEMLAELDEIRSNISKLQTDEDELVEEIEAAYVSYTAKLAARGVPVTPPKTESVQNAVERVASESTGQPRGEYGDDRQ